MVTMDYMKILMDADCLIKITKAGLKELIVTNEDIFIPEIVKWEVVDSGKKKECQDAFIVEKNIEAKAISLIKASSSYKKGDEAVIALFQKDKYDAVATDDAKFTRLLKAYNIPFILPGLIIFKLRQSGLLTKEAALGALKKLAKFISEDEYSMVRLLMEKEK